MNTKEQGAQGDRVSKDQAQYHWKRVNTSGFIAAEVEDSLLAVKRFIEQQSEPAQGALTDAVDLRGIDAGPMSEWRELVGCGLVKRDADLMLVEDAGKLLQRERERALVLVEALAALVDRNFTFFSGGMVGADKKITRDEVMAARDAIATYRSQS